MVCWPHICAPQSSAHNVDMQQFVSLLQLSVAFALVMDDAGEILCSFCCQAASASLLLDFRFWWGDITLAALGHLQQPQEVAAMVPARIQSNMYSCTSLPRGMCHTPTG